MSKRANNLSRSLSISQVNSLDKYFHIFMQFIITIKQ